MREATGKDKKMFDKAARHPLQSWSWGDFRISTGVEVTRLIDNDVQPVEVFQITWHKIPKTPYCIGYCPKSAIPSPKVLTKINELAIQRSAIFVKFEPNERIGESTVNKINELKKKYGLVKGRPLFTRYTYQLDISKPEEDLLSGMHQKTRYNIRLAQKKGVKIVQDFSENGFEEYWKLTGETTKRQRFFSHTKEYHRKMWKTMVGEGKGYLLKAVYKEKVLSTWILFILNGILYYPYGASSAENREVMANNLIMWESIRLGKKNDCKLFDMWGSLGPKPNVKDPWYGFHRFKQGYGGELVEFVGTYDLVVNGSRYVIYNQLEKIRWLYLKLITRIRG